MGRKTAKRPQPRSTQRIDTAPPAEHFERPEPAKPKHDSGDVGRLGLKLFLASLQDDPAAAAIGAWGGCESAANCAPLLMRHFVAQDWTPQRVADTSLADLAMLLPAARDDSGTIGATHAAGSEAGKPEAERPVFLDEVSARIVGFLRRQYPMLVTIERPVRPCDASEGTIKKRLEKLQQQGVIHHPEGPKAGSQLSELGKKLADSLPELSGATGLAAPKEH